MSIKCAHCKGRHDSVNTVRECATQPTLHVTPRNVDANMSDRMRKVIGVCG